MQEQNVVDKIPFLSPLFSPIPLSLSVTVDPTARVSLSLSSPLSSPPDLLASIDITRSALILSFLFCMIDFSFYWLIDRSIYFPFCDLFVEIYSWVEMAAPPARARADYDYLIKLLLIGDSGICIFFIFICLLFFPSFCQIRLFSYTFTKGIWIPDSDFR